MIIDEQPQERVARSVLSAQVKDTLLRWIVGGQLPLGSRIIETRVARQLGTSQAPVREALRDLMTLGLVEMDPYRGARVRAPMGPRNTRNTRKGEESVHRDLV